MVASITAFGQTGPYRDWKASEPVLTAMSSALTRSGAPGREPLMPPGELGSETAAVQAAFAVLLASYDADRAGRGDYVDCALFDLVVQGFDPGFGVGGSATMGQPQVLAPPERPDRRMLYPIIPCRDGHVRIFVASTRQWRALFTWMGEPEEFADPSYEQMFTRFMKWDKHPRRPSSSCSPTRAVKRSSRTAQNSVSRSRHCTLRKRCCALRMCAQRASFVRAEVAPD